VSESTSISYEQEEEHLTWPPTSFCAATIAALLWRPPAWGARAAVSVVVPDMKRDPKALSAAAAAPAREEGAPRPARVLSPTCMCIQTMMHNASRLALAVVSCKQGVMCRAQCKRPPFSLALAQTASSLSCTR
jgi:hypothetical protein